MLADLCAANGSRAAVPDAGWSRLWSRKAPDPACSLGGVARPAAQAQLERLRAADPANASFREAGGRPLGSCVDVACERVVRAVPASSSASCSWDPAFSGDEMYCLRSLLPRAAAEDGATTIVGDFTPNYLCDADALRRLVGATARPDDLRFIVLVREPMERAFSEWVHMALKWTWDPITDFGASFAARLQQLRDCNRSLFGNVAALRALPTAELSTYLRRCWGHGGAMMYAPTSLYSVCVLHALRFVRREQLLFLRYEDLRRLGAAALLRVIARFTGLHADPKLLADIDAYDAPQPPPPPPSRRDRRPKARKPPLARCDARVRNRGTYAALSPREQAHFNASRPFVESAALRRFFSPYNALLAEIVGHPSFAWSDSDS